MLFELANDFSLLEKFLVMFWALSELLGPHRGPYTSVFALCNWVFFRKDNSFMTVRPLCKQKTLFEESLPDPMLVVSLKFDGPTPHLLPRSIPGPPKFKISGPIFRGWSRPFSPVGRAGSGLPARWRIASERATPRRKDHSEPHLLEKEWTENSPRGRSRGPAKGRILGPRRYLWREV